MRISTSARNDTLDWLTYIVIMAIITLACKALWPQPKAELPERTSAAEVASTPPVR